LVELDTIPPELLHIQAIYNSDEAVFYVEGLTEAGTSITQTMEVEKLMKKVTFSYNSSSN
jgi:hypothetical protein